MPVPERDADDDRQQHHAQNVVEYCRTQNDLRCSVLEYLQVLQHAGGDADAGGDHGSGDEECLVGRLVTELQVDEAATNGRTLPAMATLREGPPIRIRSCGLVSRPTVNSRKIAPISAIEMMVSRADDVGGIGTENDASRIPPSTAAE